MVGSSAAAEINILADRCNQHPKKTLHGQSSAARVGWHKPCQNSPMVNGIVRLYLTCSVLVNEDQPARLHIFFFFGERKKSKRVAVQYLHLSEPLSFCITFTEAKCHDNVFLPLQFEAVSPPAFHHLQAISPHQEIARVRWLGVSPCFQMQIWLRFSNGRYRGRVLVCSAVFHVFFKATLSRDSSSSWEQSPDAVSCIPWGRKAAYANI